MKGIYRIQNLKTGDFYIGSSVNLTYRLWTHLKRLKNNNHHSQILQNSWNKHGEISFIYGIVEEINDSKLLIEKEQYYIDVWKPKYNICKIAGSPFGTKHTYEARQNMSLAQKGKSVKERGHKENCKCFICQRKTSYWLGKERSINTRKKLSIPIVQYDMDENYIAEWFGASEAAKHLNVIQSHITACCKNKRKSTGGFKWKYK